MKDIKKCIKKIKEYHLDVIKNSLVAMKKNVMLKKRFDTLILNNSDDINKINTVINIFNSQKHFSDDCYVNLINNYNKICKNYNDGVATLKNEINKIENILYNKYLPEIKNFYTNSNEKQNEKTLMEIYEVDLYLTKINKINFHIELNDYIKEDNALPDTITNIYKALIEI